MAVTASPWWGCLRRGGARALTDTGRCRGSQTAAAASRSTGTTHHNPPQIPHMLAGLMRVRIVAQGYFCGTHIPTVSPLMIPLIYCHIKSFQRASSVGKPEPGGDKRRGRRTSHHEACEALGSLLLPCAATGVSLLAVWCLSGATPRAGRGRPPIPSTLARAA